eukprot:5601022-Prymnesium_polylepis.2
MRTEDAKLEGKASALPPQIPPTPACTVKAYQSKASEIHNRSAAEQDHAVVSAHDATSADAV